MLSNLSIIKNEKLPGWGRHSVNKCAGEDGKKERQSHFGEDSSLETASEHGLFKAVNACENKNEVERSQETTGNGH